MGQFGREEILDRRRQGGRERSGRGGWIKTEGYKIKGLCEIALAWLHPPSTQNTKINKFLTGPN